MVISAQTATLEAPAAPIWNRGVESAAETKVVVTALGRVSPDSEVMWFNGWNPDSQSIWATVNDFLGACSAGNREMCLKFVSKNGGGQAAERVKVSIELAQSGGDVKVLAITHLFIAASRAHGIVTKVIQGQTSSEVMSFVKENGSWKIG